MGDCLRTGKPSRYITSHFNVIFQPTYLLTYLLTHLLTYLLGGIRNSNKIFLVEIEFVSGSLTFRSFSKKNK